MPEFLDIPWRLSGQAGNFLKDVGVDETCAGRSSGPKASVMACEMPGGCAAHGETAHADAVFIDGIMFADVFERFESVDFADEFVGVAEATVRVEDEGIGRSEFAAIVFAVGDEAEFAEFGVAAVVPEIEAMLVVSGRTESGRNNEAVGLDGAVDFGFVAANDEAGCRVPRCLAVVERPSAGPPFVEKLSGGGKVVGGVENIVVEGVADGVVINLDVGEESEEVGLGLERFFQIVDFVAERGDAVFQFAFDFGWHGDAFGGRADIFAGGDVGGGGDCYG